MWIRGSLLNLTVLDRQGAPAGRIVDTYPCDGSSPEFAVVRLGRFGEKVMVALDGCVQLPGGIQIPYSRVEIEDAPTVECARYHCDRMSIARGYWAMQDSGERLALG